MSKILFRDLFVTFIFHCFQVKTMFAIDVSVNAPPSALFATFHSV